MSVIYSWGKNQMAVVEVSGRNKFIQSSVFPESGMVARAQVKSKKIVISCTHIYYTVKRKTNSVAFLYPSPKDSC